MEIRAMRPEDDRMAVSRVYEESWRRAYRGIIPQDYLDAIPRGDWAPRLDRPGRHSLLAVEGGEIVGTASYSAARLAEMAGFGELISLYLLPSHWGRGIGRQLLGSAVSALGALGFREVYLWVLEDNARARGFYERCGFSRSDTVLDTEIGGKQLRELQYRMQL